MAKKDIQQKLKNLSAFFMTGRTLDVEFRKIALKNLKTSIRKNEELIVKALHADLKKPEFESYAGEIGFLYSEIDHAMKNVGRWSKPEKKRMSILNFPSTGMIYREPYGTVLIIGPWNYPFQLVFAPLVGAISAGNCSLIKPSELAPESSRVILKIIREAFPEDYICAIEGGIGESRELISSKVDYIFFTGGTSVGRIVMQAASKNLVPVTLELGGKSPAIVDYDANLAVAAKRIVWGKFFNAGQTCIAPDYLLVHKKIREQFVSFLIKSIKEFYGEDLAKSPDYARIINEKHFDRLVALSKSGKILYGGDFNRKTKYISPTLITGIKRTDPVMTEEIFGPLLPILDFSSIDEAVGFVNSMSRPLSFYYFSENRLNQKKVISGAKFGGGCINDTLSHINSTNLPFGGLGDSGMGNYHGKYGFETFSHKKSILNRSSKIDMKLRYPPYKGKLGMIKNLFKLFG